MEQRTLSFLCKELTPDFSFSPLKTGSCWETGDIVTDRFALHLTLNYNCASGATLAGFCKSSHCSISSGVKSVLAPNFTRVWDSSLVWGSRVWVPYWTPVWTKEEVTELSLPDSSVHWKKTGACEETEKNETKEVTEIAQKYNRKGWEREKKGENWPWGSLENYC